MGADQQFCLRWNNFHTNITSAFESLRDDEDFVDITLACEGRQVKAHKMVLSACSPYFRSLLKGNPCQHPIVFLKDVTFANLASILDFMYHGEVNVSHHELATFLKTAEALKVRGLAEDDKRKDSDGYVEASSPGPPRDPPDPGSPRPDETSATDTHLSDSPPPHKKQRRRSGTSVQSTEDTNETVISEIKETSVKNEPQEFNDEDDMLCHSVDTGDIKTDNTVNDESDERNNFGISESVTISRSQAAMQQLQESFGSFLPTMSQSSGFLPHGATEMPRPPFPLEGVQGLPPGISALPGPSMSQAGASQDTSQGRGDAVRVRGCKRLSSEAAAAALLAPARGHEGTAWQCEFCFKYYGSNNSLRNHRSVYHRGMGAAAAAASLMDHNHHNQKGQQQQQQQQPPLPLQPQPPPQRLLPSTSYNHTIHQHDSCYQSPPVSLSLPSSSLSPLTPHNNSRFAKEK